MDEYNQLSTLDQAYVSKYGWDSFRKKKELEENARRLQQQWQQPEPVQEEEDSEEDIEEEEVQETEQSSELDDLKLENEQKKSEILDKIEDKLDEEDATSRFWQEVHKSPELEAIVQTWLLALSHLANNADTFTVKVTKTGDKTQFEFHFFKDGKEVTIEGFV
jgi:hypothetical protein